MQKAILVLSVAVMLAAVCSAADKIDLKLRLAAGASHEMKMTQTQDISQTMQGQQMNVRQTQDMVLAMDCLAVDANGNMDVKMKYKSMKMSIEGPMGKIEFDSENPAAPDPNRPDMKMMNAIFSAMVGSEFQMTLTPTGETSNIKGLAEMLKKLKDKVGEQAGPAEMFIDKMFDENQVKEMTGNMMAVYPNDAVAVGDSWYDTKSINFMLPIDLDTTYMLKSVSSETAVIDAISKLDMGDSSKIIDIDPNNKMAMQLAGTINATNEVDVKTGLTKKSNVKMDFTGMLKMESNPQMPEGITMPITIKGSAVMELIK